MGADKPPRTYPSAPPRPRPPAPLPQSVRVYAHIHGWFDLACPACGTMHAVGRQAGKRRYRKHHAQASGYDSLSGALVCKGCGRSWVLGVVVWPLASRGRGRPEDHVPTREEAAALREVYGTGWAKEDGERKGARERVNLVCVCGLECPAHPKGEDDVR